MIRLKSRAHQIPHGFKFKLPEAKWEAVPWSSFDTIVDAAYTVGRANPYLVKKLNWPTTREGWADKIDLYNAKLCESHGWGNYIVDDGGGAFAPKSPAHSLNVARLAVGAGTIKEMFGPEGPTNKEQATARAHVCADCPMNEKTRDWTSYFTEMAAKGIRSVLGFLKDMDLTTDADARLGVCSICLCPMRTKVWARASHIKKHMPQEDIDRLPPNCWLPPELKQLP